MVFTIDSYFEGQPDDEIPDVSTANVADDTANQLESPSFPPPFPISSPPLFCSVCGDTVQCNRYGVVSCHACARFFRRAICNRAAFKCWGNNDCVVEKAYRNKCQACRLTKCLAIGMRTDRMWITPPNPLNPINPPRAQEPKLAVPTPVCAPVVPYVPQRDEVLYKATMAHLEEVMSWAQELPMFSILDHAQKRHLFQLNWRNLVKFSMCEKAEKTFYDEIIVVLTGKMQRFEPSADEYNHMKAILLFTTPLSGVRYEKHYQQCICFLEQCCRLRDATPCRFGELMMLISEIQCRQPKKIVTLSSVEVVQVANRLL